MGQIRPERLQEDADTLALRRDARAALGAYQAFLANPAFVHRIDLAVLTKIAGDDTMPARERRRAAEVLSRLYLTALEKVAELSGAKEQALKDLGLEKSGTPVSLTQVNTKIEIVREGDWRAGDGRG